MIPTWVTDEDFAIWAFGKKKWEAFLRYDCDSIELMRAWNRRHGKLLKLYADDPIGCSMEEMKLLWREYEKKRA